MKNTIKYLAIAAALVLGLASCTKKAPEYQPAPAVGNAEVFFAPNQPTTVNLKGNEGVISVGVKRVQTASSLTATISSTSPSLFTVPSSVTFDAGAATAVLNITFQPASLEEEVEYAFNLTITSDTTPYGSSEYNFIASIPAAWQKFGTGTLTEDWWGEVETKMTLWYQDIDSHTRLCKIEKCFGHDTGPTYDVQDYMFYWDTETNFLRIPMHYMGYTNTDGYKVYYGDAESFFRDVYDYTDEMMQRNGYASVEDYAYNAQGYTRPYYDGNGGFYLASWYFFSKEDKAGSGYSFGDSVDIFIADGFVRKTDYNGEKFFGASSALYEGYAESWMLSNDASYPYEFEANMRYDASYLDNAKLDEDGNFDVNAKENQGLTTTYYITDYFGEDQCLAFTAPVPELLKEGSEISDVDNEQTTGLQFMGNDLYVNVKKGSVSFENDDEFPTFYIILSVFSMDEEGNVTYNFGTANEMYQALDYGKDNYTIDDIYGGYKEDYIGTWEMTAIDSSGSPYNYYMAIEDNGTDEEGNEWLKIHNLTGWTGSYGLVDDVDALYSGYVIYVFGGQVLETPFVMGDYVSSVKINLYDPDSGKNYSSPNNSVLGGICSDGNFAFVNRYNGVNLCGFYYSLPDIDMYLDVAYYIWGEKISNETSSLGRNGQFGRFQEKDTVAGYGVLANNYDKIGTANRGTKLQSAKTVRMVNLSGCKKADKEAELQIITLK